MRSAGEQAFDRCFFALLLNLIFLPAAFLLPVFHSKGDDMPAVPALIVWALFLLGVLLFIHWRWALHSVIAAWRDPFAKVLRFSSLGLLLFAAGNIFGLLRLPFF